MPCERSFRCKIFILIFTRAQQLKERALSFESFKSLVFMVVAAAAAVVTLMLALGWNFKANQTFAGIFHIWMWYYGKHTSAAQRANSILYVIYSGRCTKIRWPVVDFSSFFFGNAPNRRQWPPANINFQRRKFSVYSHKCYRTCCEIAECIHLAKSNWAELCVCLGWRRFWVIGWVVSGKNVASLRFRWKWYARTHFVRVSVQMWSVF